MCKIIIFVVLSFFLFCTSFTASSIESDPLERLLKTDDSSLQRESLHEILNGKSDYSRQLTQKIASCYKRKGSYEELSKLLYVAALVRCKEAVPVLEKIWLDRTSFEDDCVYCCPRSLVMTVLGLHGLWTPHNISAEQRRVAPVGDTLHALERFGKGSQFASIREKPNLEGSGEEAILGRKYLTLSDEKLLAIVTDSRSSYRERYVASIELKSRVIDDHLLADYYWWALNACDDDAGECLCFAHETILLAEFYSSQHKR